LNDDSPLRRVWDEGKSWDSLMQGATLVQSHLEDVGGAIQVCVCVCVCA